MNPFVIIFGIDAILLIIGILMIPISVILNIFFRD